MWAVLGSLVDAIHALLMVVWVAGMPLLFWHRWPRLTRAYAIYAVTFAGISQISRKLLGECFITTIARYFWEHGSPPRGADIDEWFTVRFSQAVFHMTPSHRSVVIVSEALIVVTAIGILVSRRHLRRVDEPQALPAAPQGPRA
jgi:hypothetical protein